MMYWLAQQLVPYISSFNLFTYVSSRAIFTAMTALIIGWVIGPAFICNMRRAKQEQPVRDDGPQSHLQKEKTPTMGGLLILASLFLSVLLWGDLTNKHLLVVLLTTFGFAVVGYADDYLKVKGKNSKGISARAKILMQSAVAIAALFFLWKGDLVGGNYDTTVPYMKDIVLPLGVVGFFALGYLAIVGASNAVNLTDGLDGLAILPAVMVAGGLGIYAYASGHVFFADYLGLSYIKGSHELVIFCAALIGSGLAFLWFNAHPAQVFMGDVGSLALGAGLGLVAVMVRQEIIFVIMSGVFVVEAISVMLQVGSFKTMGRRVFLMAPLHHHFELKGWQENQVVVRFWIITIVLVMVGLAGLKIR